MVIRLGSRGEAGAEAEDAVVAEADLRGVGVVVTVLGGAWITAS